MIFWLNLARIYAIAVTLFMAFIMGAVQKYSGGIFNTIETISLLSCVFSAIVYIILTILVHKSHEINKPSSADYQRIVALERLDNEKSHMILHLNERIKALEGRYGSKSISSDAQPYYS